MRTSILAVLATLASPAVAQTPIERVEKARAEVNTAENALGRAIYALDRALVDLKAPTPTPVHEHPAPTQAAWMIAPSVAGKAPIPAAFDLHLGLQKAWGSGAIPKSAAPDYLGAFRMVCGAGDLAYVDPVVYPGTVGQSHLHQFYGLLNVRPDETYETSLAGKRQSTCGQGEYALNKSNYWLPALLDGKGFVLQPNYVTIYYKRRPKTDPLCNWNTAAKGQGEECVMMPQGLRMIAGFDMLDPKATAATKSAGAAFYCSGTGAGSAKADNLEAVLPTCPGGTELHVVMDFPSCWDGKHLDSPDHRSHVAYPAYGPDGALRCPRTHPKIIPTIHIAGAYSIAAEDDRSLFRLSSDRDNLPRGKTLHGDVTIAWEPTALRAFHENCIDKLLNCSGGDLGNGQQLKGAAQPSYGWKNPQRRVPVPARPQA